MHGERAASRRLQRDNAEFSGKRKYARCKARGYYSRAVVPRDTAFRRESAEPCIKKWMKEINRARRARIGPIGIWVIFLILFDKEKFLDIDHRQRVEVICESFRYIKKIESPSLRIVRKISARNVILDVKKKKKNVTNKGRYLRDFALHHHSTKC